MDLNNMKQVDGIASYLDDATELFLQKQKIVSQELKSTHDFK
jgi:hypothetical protein